MKLVFIYTLVYFGETGVASEYDTSNLRHSDLNIFPIKCQRFSVNNILCDAVFFLKKA